MLEDAAWNLRRAIEGHFAAKYGLCDDGHYDEFADKCILRPFQMTMRTDSVEVLSVKRGSEQSVEGEYVMLFCRRNVER